MHSVVERLGAIGLVPVVKINDAEQAAPLAHALVAGGLPCAEVTFRTACAAEAIARMAAAEPELVVGAGTVLTPEQVDEAVAAGAQFVVAPGFNPRVVDHAIAAGVPMMPGIANASGVEAALERGLDAVKFFPAEQAGGLAYIQALAGPYAGVTFMPTGGINPANLGSYLACGSILCCGGTWMVKESLLDAGDWAEVERLCAEGAAIVRQVRG